MISMAFSLTEMAITITIFPENIIFNLCPVTILVQGKN
ncbi:hypothetical protein B932_1602 [Gluconobacter oxydans H24]|nr:hypothetical protein B932_1602 [Gluconobacter oxydans H24]